MPPTPLPALSYAVENNHNGVIPNATASKDSMRYAEYKANEGEEALKKPRARSQMIAELENLIHEEVMPLQVR